MNPESPTNRSRFKAFTLIELLIVVAIIAILAAIAVPNFLEAQIRSKVSRAKNDIRALATAAEAYYVDHNDYPPNNAGAVGGTLGAQTRYMEPLSTPIAYISTARYTDPFGNENFLNVGGQSFYFFYRSSFTDFLANIVVEGAFTGANAQADKDAIYSWRYTIGSAGPDRLFVVQYALGLNFTYPQSWQEWIRWARRGDDVYDPTNGTVSQGDIWRTHKGQREGSRAN